jgi:hypothetical protein
VEERTACACAAGSITDKGNDTGATTCMACAAGQRAVLDGLGARWLHQVHGASAALRVAAAVAGRGRGGGVGPWALGTAGCWLLEGSDGQEGDGDAGCVARGARSEEGLWLYKHRQCLWFVVAVASQNRARQRLAP